MSSAAFRQILQDCDVGRARAAWAQIAPGMPQPASDDEALVIIHRARTEMASMPFQARAYSHRWLTERGYPSGLPDALKPKAERMYPVVVEAVGIAVKAVAEYRKPLAAALQRAMADAVEDCYANGDRDPAIVRARMQEAQVKTLRIA